MSASVAILHVTTLSRFCNQLMMSKKASGFSAVSWQLSHIHGKTIQILCNSSSKWAQIQEKWFSLLAAQLNGPSLLCGHFGKRCATLHSMAKGQKLSKFAIIKNYILWQHMATSFLIRKKDTEASEKYVFCDQNIPKPIKTKQSRKNYRFWHTMQTPWLVFAIYVGLRQWIEMLSQ